MISLDIDGVIGSLLSVRHCRPDYVVRLREEDISALCKNAREIFLNQPMLLKLDAPVKICGDLHGEYFDLLRVFDKGGFPPESNYLFLGDYVDSGIRSVETICLLLAYKVKYPEKFHLLRGNHETAKLTRMYGFYTECAMKYNVKLWKTFLDCFDCMPVAAIIEKSIFCCHGGLSPDLEDMDQINHISRPTDVPESGLLCDLLWSDPHNHVTGWHPSYRRVSYVFGPDVISEFLRKFNLDLICRAHQCFKTGYTFHAERQLVTIFSSPSRNNNKEGSIMTVDANLTCSFQTLRPLDPEISFTES